MSRVIRFRAGDIVSYCGSQYIAIEVYPYIAYLKKLSQGNNAKDEPAICVGMGDLVMGGAYLVNKSNRDVFSYSGPGKFRYSKLTA